MKIVKRNRKRRTNWYDFPRVQTVEKPWEIEDSRWLGDEQYKFAPAGSTRRSQSRPDPNRSTPESN